jgi:hypothetical protein
MGAALVGAGVGRAGGERVSGIRWYSYHNADTGRDYRVISNTCVDGVYGNRRTLASLHANPWCSAMRRAKHFQGAEWNAWGHGVAGDWSAHDYNEAFQATLGSVR